ncbi:MAG: HEAT repeat domain-containing protein [bacterium]|nr:HEAT repeat domain-containing protein [bacterium]
MSQASPSRESVSPLLLELARSVRAREFYPRTHPAMRDALEHMTGLWLAALVHMNGIDLSFRQASFVLSKGGEMRGPGIDDLAGALLVRRVRRLRVLPELEAGELAALVEVLVMDPESLLAIGGFQQGLEDAGVFNVTTLEPKPDEGIALASPVRAEPTTESEPAEKAAPVETPVSSDDTVMLVRQLAEIEICEDPLEYAKRAAEIGSTVAAMLRHGDRIDAYRSMLVFARHADGRLHKNEIRREAAERLRALARDPSLMEFLLGQACATSGLTSVQATQALMCIGPSAVPHLLRRLNQVGSNTQGQTTAVLIAMGGQALPAVVEELSTTEPERARRAARLLGEMQNPEGVEFLLNSLRSRDNRIRREGARALARIGSEKALHGLIEALASPEPGLAVAAAAALGRARGSRAIPALAAALDDHSGASEEVRREAIQSLGRIGGSGAISVLEKVLGQNALLQRRRLRERQALAAQAIARIGGDQARRVLTAYLRDGGGDVRRLCEAALEQMVVPATP